MDIPAKQLAERIHGMSVGGATEYPALEKLIGED
jgi:hypothetical protein